MLKFKGPRNPAIYLLPLFFGISSASISDAWAYTHALPPSLAIEALSESVPTAIAPNDFEASDFSVEWLGESIPGVDVALGPRSLEWVRVADVLVLPRARMIFNIKDIDAGQVSHGGFNQVVSIDERIGRAEIPVALISDRLNATRVSIKRNGQVFRGELITRFKPTKRAGKGTTRTRFLTDPSCSSFHVSGSEQITSDQIAGEQTPDDWIMVGCRLVRVEGSEHPTASLEIFLYWDNVGQIIKVNGIDTPASSLSTWALRLRSSPGTVRFKAQNREIVLNYSVADRMHMASIGLGIGPYMNTLNAPNSNINLVAPVLTLYGNYFLTESLRFVMFDATALHSNYYTDLGFYLNSESFKVIDRRIIVNLMLGFHTLWFQARNKTNFRFGVPQGMEMIFRDTLLKGHDASTGGFIYPTIDGKAYYNVWARWGSPSMFMEFNYIRWQEMLGDRPVFSKSVGISFGFPLFRFL